MDIKRAAESLPNPAWSRREFVTGLLASGFALAAHPLAAQTMIVTDSAGLKAGEVQIPTADRPIPAYRAMPERAGPFPVVLVVQEIFGVHEHIRDVCRRLAKLGYLAIAPELFIRQGDVSRLSDIGQIIKEVVSKVPDRQVLSDLDAAVAWVRGSGEGDLTRLGITGFCYGGRITWLYAAHNRQLRAAAAWYGRLSGQTSPLQPEQPMDIAASLTVPVLGLYGGADQGIPVATVEQMRQALGKGSSGSQIVLYEGAPHAFFADYRPSYRKPAADDGWRRMLAWFKDNGLVTDAAASRDVYPSRVTG